MSLHLCYQRILICLKWDTLTLHDDISVNEMHDPVPDIDDLSQNVEHLSLSARLRSTAPGPKSESNRAKGPYIWTDVRDFWSNKISPLFFTANCVQINASCLLRAPRHSQRHITMMTRAQHDVRRYNRFTRLKPETAFRQAPGGMLYALHYLFMLTAVLVAINKIVQAPNMIAFCSAAVGGHPDGDDNDPGNSV
jgi:hypothetical protein